MHYYLCDIETVEDEDNGTVRRPTIARYSRDWNTYGAYDEATQTVLVASPDNVQGDPTVRHLAETEETFDDIARGRITNTKALDATSKRRISDTLKKAGLTVVLDGKTNSDEVMREAFRAIRARHK